MCWIDDLLDFWFPRGLSDGAEGESGRQEPLGSAEVPEPLEARSGPSASSLSPLLVIPEFYLRPELIPCEPCPSAIEEAERVVSNKQGGTPLTVKNIQDALRRLRR